MNFNSPYNREEYVKFFRDQLLPEDFLQSSENISPGFSAQYTREVTKIGRSNSLDLTIYEIRHASENDPRVSLSKESFKLLAEYGQKCALALFISDSSENYRLSLVTIDLKWEEGKRTTKEYSNPRRLSFFLGRDAKIHTPQQYLLKPGRIKDFEDLKKRFSIEVVNKDFYTEIAILFTKLTGGTRKIGSKTIEVKKGLLEFPSPDDTKRKEFAVRLIGRLVFCWFLKKKYSRQNVPLLPEELLSMDAIDKNKGYYHNILEPLFFQVLNTPVDERVKTFISKPWSIIPFLNGGLFTPHDDDHYTPDDFQGISPRGDLKVPDDWLLELLKIFETYNFTIDENTPVDVELSIEPEMLGRIFENLLAEINPDTGETARKATGSYYTPRPIVEYMVDESVKQYLLTKTKFPEDKISALLSYAQEAPDLTDAQKDEVLNALDTIKVIDPACGSGAFPMGILQKILLILQKIDPDSRKWLEKKTAGIPDTLEGREFKRKLANEDWDYVRKLGIIRDAIYGVDIQSVAVEISKLRCFLSLMVDQNVDDSEDNRGVEHLPNLEFKFVCANSLIGLPKRPAQTTMFEAREAIIDLERLRDDCFQAEIPKQELLYRYSKIRRKILEHIDNWGGRDELTLKLTEWNPFSDEPSSWFDPEWMFGIKDGFDIVIANPPYGSELKSTEKEYLESKYKEYVSQTKNSAIYFAYLAETLLTSLGAHSFIVPKSLSYSNGWSNCAEFVLRGLNKLIDTGKAFEDVKLEQVVFVRIRGFNSTFYINGLYDEQEIKEFAQVEKDLYRKHKVLLTGQTPEEVTLIKRIDSTCPHVFGDYVSIKRGLNWQSKAKQFPGDTPIHRGAQLSPYYLEDATDFIDLNKFRKEEYDYQLRPKILNQLAIAHVKNPYPHFYLQSALDENNKLVFETISCTFIRNDSINIKFLLGLNNSKLFAWLLYKLIYSNAIRSTRYDDQYVGRIPCPDLGTVEQRILINTVDKILEITKSRDCLINKSKQVEIKELEKQIDQMVYGLYGLTDAEIAIVEGHSKVN